MELPFWYVIVPPWGPGERSHHRKGVNPRAVLWQVIWLLAWMTRGRGSASAMHAVDMARRARRAVRGTTLLEVLVAASLSAILLAIAVPNLPGLGAPFTLRTVSQQVAADLIAARMRAIATDTPYRVAFNTAAATYVIQQETAPGTFVTEGGTRTLPAGVVLGPVAANPIFDTRGMLAAALAVPITVSPAGSRTVSVNVLGRTTIQ